MNINIKSLRVIMGLTVTSQPPRPLPIPALGTGPHFSPARDSSFPVASDWEQCNSPGLREGTSLPSFIKNSRASYIIELKMYKIVIYIILFSPLTLKSIYGF